MRFKLSYANVVSTLALFLVLGGGAAYAASKISTDQLRHQAVTAKKIQPGAVTSGKLADAAVWSRTIKDGSVHPSKLAFPVFYAATPSGGSQAVTDSQNSYPLSDNQWTQQANAINVIFGEGNATLAYDGSGSGSCQVYFDIRLDGQAVGGGQLQTSSTTPETVTQPLGAQPAVGPQESTERTLTVEVSSNGDCATDSTIDSTRFQVLNFG